MSARNLFDLTGKVALVTGGSRGLGLQMAEALGELGARVAISARKGDELEAASARLKAKGIEALTVINDLGDMATNPAEALTDAVLARWSAIDILVNNAGMVRGGPAETTTDEMWHKVMALNVDACFAMARAAAHKSMIPRRSGKIINIASVAGLGGPRPDGGIFAASYHTSKGALISMTLALASEWGQYGINVNAICPGYFPTKLSAGLAAGAAQILRATPLGRAGGEEDLKGVVAFFASDASRHVTGQALAVDGGSSMTIT